MKKLLVVTFLLACVAGGCLPAAPQQAATPLPISEEELQATAALLSRLTLEAMPTGTPRPSETPVILPATETPTSKPPTEIPTETPNPVLLTLTATLGAGTAEGTGGLGSLPFTNTPAMTQAEPQPLSHGTLPPQIPFGEILINNRANVDAYISLRCVTADGNVTILEYPVKTSAEGRAPAGQYTYIAWVGGTQFSGSFALAKGEEITINLHKDRVAITR
jgi:hypothetical protein